MCSNQVSCCALQPDVPAGVLLCPFLCVYPFPAPISSLFLSLSLTSFLGSFSLLRANFESAAGAFLSNLLLLDFLSELLTFWHKFAVVHDEERTVSFFSKS